jgi:Sulfotransferase family
MPNPANGSSPDSFVTRNGPLFVVGMWRSGTSLFYRLLNRHPQIALMYEGDLGLFRPLFYPASQKSRWTEHWDFWSGALRRHGIDPNSIPSGIRDFKTAIETVYRSYAGPDVIWGCKSPNYYDRLDMLHDMFPDARFIVIWRDPRDVCRSVARAGQAEYSWFARRWMFERALFGCRLLRRQYDELVARRAHVHQVTYEELVSDPTHVMRGVSAFLNVPFDAATASLTGGDHSAIENAAHHKKVKSDRISKPEDRDEVLSPEELHKVESYIRLWQDEFRSAWPTLRKPLDLGVKKPSWREEFLDALNYKRILTWDRLRLGIYCYAPMWLLKQYRKVARKPIPLSRNASAPEPETVTRVS